MPPVHRGPPRLGPLIGRHLVRLAEAERCPLVAVLPGAGDRRIAPALAALAARLAPGQRRPAEHLADHLLLQPPVHPSAPLAQNGAAARAGLRRGRRRRLGTGRRGLGRRRPRLLSSCLRLAQEPLRENVLVHVDRHLGHLGVVRLPLKDAPLLRRAPCLVGARGTGFRARRHEPVGDVQHAEVLGQERKQRRVVPLHGLVELVLPGHERLAHRAARELKDVVVAAHLVVERLQLHHVRRRLVCVLDVVVPPAVHPHSAVVGEPRGRDGDGLLPRREVRRAGKRRCGLAHLAPAQLRALVGTARLGRGAGADTVGRGLARLGAE